MGRGMIALSRMGRNSRQLTPATSFWRQKPALAVRVSWVSDFSKDILGWKIRVSPGVKVAPTIDTSLCFQGSLFSKTKLEVVAFRA